MTVHVKDNRTLGKRVSAMLTSVTLALLALVLALLCSCSSPADTTENTSDTAISDSADVTINDQVVSTAMVVGVQGDSVLLVDQDTQTPYYPTSSTATVTDIDGNAIALVDLVPGNVVEVVGNNIMLESYPGQYPGITSITVTEVGTPEDANEYADLVAEVMPEPSNGVPSGYVEYTDDLGIVSALLAPYAYTWEPANSDDYDELSGTFFEADGTIVANINDVRIANATGVTLGFDINPEDLTVQRVLLTDTGEGETLAIDSTAAGESVAVKASNGVYTLTVEPNYAYVIRASYADGNAEYAFVALEK